MAEVVPRSSREVIEYFVHTSDAWAGSHPHNGDVTFVVIRVDDGEKRG